MVINITDDNYEQMVNIAEKLVIVDFWANWCAPCRQIAPVLDEISDNLSDKVQVCKIDIDANPNKASELGVRAIPTMLFYKSGQIIYKQVGIISRTLLYDKINELL